MLSTVMDVLAAIVGVILAPFVVQGIIKPKSKAGVVAQWVVGVVFVGGFLFVWAQYGRDPLQLAVCQAFPKANACPKAPLSKAENVARIVGTWKVGPNGTCKDGNTIAYQDDKLIVNLKGVKFTENVEDYTDEHIRTVVLTPVINQRYEFRIIDGGNKIDVAQNNGGETVRWEKCQES